MRSLFTFTFALCFLIGWHTHAQSVQSLTLINADTDTDIKLLSNGETLNLATLPTTNLNVRANTSPATVGSVRFAYDGNANFQTESVAPYALAGDTNGDYDPWTPTVGSHTLTATPYSGASGGGTAGTSLTVNFTVINQTATTVPAAPSNLTATAPSPTEVVLSWNDNSTNEAQFIVERQFATSVPAEEIAWLPANTTTYTDNTLSDGDRATYQVKAVNSAGSSLSNKVSIFTPHGPPQPPTNLVATSLSSTEIYLTWDSAPFGNDYVIERSPSPTSGFEQVDASYISDTRHTSYDLEPNTTYYYRIKTIFSKEPSTYSEVASATTFVETTLYAINAGGGAYTAADGTQFTADQRASGGTPFSTTASIAGTDDDPIYQSERYGDFTYQLPVADGDYKVTLLFAEIYANSSNQRVFDVLLEGQERISNLDLYAIVGKNKAYQVSENVEVTDGSLTIAFSSDIDNAKLAGLLVSGTEADPDPNPGTATVSGELRKWHKVSLTFDGPFHNEADVNPNPFLDYRLNVTFTHSASGKSYTVPGYFAADGRASESSASSGNKWRVHFRPDETGTWNYTTSFRSGSNVAISTDSGAGIANSTINGVSGSLTIAASNKTGRDFRAKGRLEYVEKRYLQFAETGEYFVKGGSDAPENFLAYEDFDNTPNNGGRRKSWSPHASDWASGDPSWQNGKGTEIIGALNYLASEEANAFSFLTLNINGDDKNVYPYVTDSDFKHFDVSKLDQWETVFAHAQTEGLYLHFKTQETENDQLLDGGNLGVDRKLYYRTLIARFGHHLALNWNLGEENDIWSELNDPNNTRVKAYAQYIHEVDPYDHHIVIHTYPGQQDAVYDPLLGNQSLLTGASIQTNYANVYRETKKWVDDSQAAGKPWVVANDEQGGANIGVPPDLGYTDPSSGITYQGQDLQGNTVTVSQDDIRKKTLWGNLMAGGAGVEYYYGYQLPQSDLTLQDFRSRDRMWDYTRYALRFFNQHLPFAEMTPDNALVTKGWCLAKRGEIYAVYLESGGTGSINLGSNGASYSVQWYNPRNGGSLQTGSVASVTASGSVSFGNPPGSTNQDWVVLLTSQGDNPPPPPSSVVKANAGPDRTVSVNVSQPYQIRGIPEGPNPFRQFLWEKVSGPSLTLNGNSANAKLSNLQVGTYVLRFTATDSEGNSGSDEMTLTVTGSNARLTSQQAKTAVIDPEAMTALMAYPNPAREYLVVRVPASEQAGVLVMTDLSGKQVRRLTSGEFAKEYTLDIQDVPAGMYLVRWQSDRLYTTKVLVER